MSKSAKVLIYGKHPVIAALRNPKRQCRKLYTTKAIWQELQQQFSTLNIDKQLCTPSELDSLLKFDTNHQNIILETEPLKALEIEDIIHDSSCLVILDQITDPHNIGAIIRSAAAFSADAIILPSHNSPKEHSTIIKCAAGAYESTPLIYINNLVNCINTLKKEGYWIIGLDGYAKEELNPKIFSEKIAIILGAEDTGMRRLTKENCDYLIKIPISSNLESLNVSNAAAITLYEFSKYKKTTT